MKNLIIDLANLTSIIRFGVMSKNSSTLLMTDEEWTSYFLDSMLISLANYVNVLKADRVILTQESKSWRKTHYPLYKANREAGKEEDDKLELFYSAANKASDFMHDFTNAKVIRVNGAEGDDIVAVLAQKFSTEGETSIIVSTDGDFKQLLRYKGVKIFNPIKKVYVTNYSHVEYITKIVKGDNGDNIPSTYPYIKPEILESIANDENQLEYHFDIVDKTIERQKFYIAKFLKIEKIPDDLTEEEWEEVLTFSRQQKDDLLMKVKVSKSDKEFNDDVKLQHSYKLLKDILKLSKKEGITEAKLFKPIQSFRDGYKRNEKLICLKLDNLPSHIVDSIIKEYNNDHSAKKQSEFLKFVRSHKLKEFAFGQEWSTLKAIKNI